MVDTATQAHGGLVEAFDAALDDRPDVDRHEVFRRLRADSIFGASG